MKVILQEALKKLAENATFYILFIRINEAKNVISINSNTY